MVDLFQGVFELIYLGMDVLSSNIDVRAQGHVGDSMAKIGHAGVPSSSEEETAPKTPPPLTTVSYYELRGRWW